MKKNKGTGYLVSTIILSIMAIIGLILIIPVILFSVKDALASIQPSEDASGGEIIASGAAGIAISLVIVLYYFFAGFEVIISIIGIIMGIINRKSENKKLRYYNFVLIGLMAIIGIASIVKIILWRCGY